MKSAPLLGSAALAASLLLAPVASAATYYVSTTGNDANAGTSTSAPWRTIQKAASSAVAGSTVNVAAGTYKERVTVNVSGSAAAGPITFQGAAGHTTIIDASGMTVSTPLFYINNRNFIRIQGFVIRNYTTGSSSQVPVGIRVQGTSNNIQLTGNKIHNIANTSSAGNAHGIAVFGTGTTDATAIHELLIDGNELYDLKLGNSEALVLNGNVRDFDVTNNLLRNNNNIGIDFIGFEGTSASSTWDQARFGLCAGNTVIGSSSRNNPSYNEYSSAGIYVDGGRDIVVERNRVTGSDIGIELASEHAGRSTSNVTVRNNFLYRNKVAGIAIGGYDTARGRSDSCKILNNTLFQNHTVTDDDSWGEIYVQHFVYNAVIKNNVIFAGPANLFIYNAFTDNSGSVVDYNDYYSAAGAGAGKWRWRNVLYSGWTNYKKTPTSNRSGNELNGQFLNPALVSESTSAPDLHLKTTSPVIDKGDSAVALATDLDIDGQSRVQGVKVDLGADEVPSGPPPPPTPPQAPSGLTATGAPGSVALGWADNSGNESLFKIERKLAVDPDSAFVQVATAPAGSTAYSEAPPPETYSYRVRASNSAGDSAYTNVATATVTPPPQPPAAPSDLTATGGEGQVALAWVDNSADETEFRIERATEPGGTFSQIATVGAGVTSYTNLGVPAGIYTYRVRAANPAGASGYSNPATAIVTAPPGPEAPSNLMATVGGGTSVTLSWQDNSSTETGFRVERKVGTGSFTLLTTKTNNTTSHVDGPLAPGSYTYRVIATGTVSSAPSGEASATLANPVADAFIKDGTSANVNFGAAALIEVKWTPDVNTNRKGFARFSLSGVGSTVVSAKLRLYGVSKDSQKSVTVHGVANVTWAESTLTWSSPTVGGPPMSSALGPAMPVPFVAGTGPVPSAWVEWDVTSWVQQQRIAGASLVSLGLQSADLKTDGQISFSSREATITGNRPVLIISSR